MEHIIEVKLGTGRSLLRRTCLLCNGSTEKDGTYAIVYSNLVDVPKPGKGLRKTDLVVCPGCLKRHRADLVGVILENAFWHRLRARELEQIAGNLPPLPTYAEWEQACRDRDIVQ